MCYISVTHHFITPLFDHLLILFWTILGVNTLFLCHFDPFLGIWSGTDGPRYTFIHFI